MTSVAGPAGNVYDKYNSRNPIARRLMSGFLRSFDELVAITGAEDVHEVGCGEGELSIRMCRAGKRVSGSDVSSEVIAEAQERAKQAGVSANFRARSLHDLEPDEDASSLVVCCEVLEHVPDPEQALLRLIRLARPWILVSVPREPIWRVLNLVRFRYVTSFGNTPGHINHWSSSGFERFVRNQAEVVVTRKPLPWTMLLCASSSYPASGRRVSSCVA